MSGTYTNVNLSKLPFPAVVELLSPEQIVAQCVAELVLLDPAFTALVPSDPAYKIFEVTAKREFLLRHRVNESCKAVTLAYATGSDLDQLAARYTVARRVIDEGDAGATPPVLPTMESDDD